MQCIIHSKVRQTNSIMKQLPSSDKKVNYDIDSLINDISKISLEEINFGHGLLLDIDGFKCIVTCSHIVGKANMRINILLEDINKNVCSESCKLALNIEEYEIAVLEIENKRNEKKYKFYEITEKIKIKTDLRYTIFFNTLEGIISSSFVENIINVSKISIEKQHIKSIYLPAIPCVVVESDNLPEDLHGLSGSIVTDPDKNPVAIVSHTTDFDNKINCIPLSFAVKFIRECIKGNKTSLIFSSVFIDFDKIEIEYKERHLTCYCVKNNHKITYPSTNKKKTKIEIGDIIFKVNNFDINSEGEIYHDEIGLNLDFFAYVMIESISDKFVKLDLFRVNDSGEYNDKIVSITLFGISVESVYNIGICNKNNYVVFKNNVFSELSYELIKELIKEGYISRTIFKSNLIKMGNINQKIIIMFDGNDVKIVDKIGNKKINSLTDIKNVKFNSNSNLKITCNTLDENKIKITI